MSGKYNSESKLNILKNEVGIIRATTTDKAFCDLYDEVEEAIREMEKTDNSMIWIAFNKYFRLQLKILMNWKF